MERLNARMPASDHEALDQVAEFACVARPIVTGKPSESGVTNVLRLAAIGCGKLREEMTCQDRDIFDTLTQGRNRERYYVQPIKKVFAEKPFANLLLEFFIGRGDHPHIHDRGVIGAHALEPLLFQYPQYLRLRTQTHIADFVQKKRAVIGLLEFPNLIFTSASEAALHVAK